MLSRALTHVHGGPHAAKTLVIGTMMTLLSFLVVPLLLLTGYAVRVAERIVDEPHSQEEGAPPFDEWGTIFYEGGKALAVGIAYALPPVLVLAVTGAVSTANSGGLYSIGAPTPLTFVGFAVAGLLVLPCWYVGAAGFVNFVRMGRFSDAFKFSQFTHILKSSVYARRWLLALGLVVVYGVLGGVFALLPYNVGVVPAAVVGFYVSVASTFLYAHGFEEARTLETATDDSTSQATA
jgi:hypothetical protein